MMSANVRAMAKRPARVSLWAFAVLFGVSSAFGWGGGHDEVAKLYGQHMPPEVKQFLGEWQGRLDWWCHYPDMTNFGWGNRRYMVVDDLRREIGDYAETFVKWGFRHAEWFHRHRGRAVLFFMLKEAFRANDAKLAAFCLSVISHSVSDQGALNHVPILQFTSYSHFAGIDYGRRNNCEFTLKDKGVAAILQRRLDAYRPKLLAPTFREAVVAMAMDAYRQGEVAAKNEISIAFGDKTSSVEGMAEVVAVQLESLLDMAWTAWTLRNESFELDEACLGEIPRQEEIRRRQSDPAEQAVYHDLFDVSKNPTPAKGTVGFVFEPYGSFHVKSLSYVGKMLGAAYARTLRDDGYAVRAISYWGIEKSGLPAPSEVPTVVVFAGRGYGIPAATVTAFKRYRNAGGCLIWIGGRDEHDVTGMKDVLVRRADEEVPVSSKWAIQNEAVWGNMKVTFADGFGDLGGQTFRFVRNPNFDGFCKPECMFSIKCAEGVVPLVWLDNGKERFCVGGRRGSVVWLPEYLFLPFLFSSEKTVNWADMRLDSFGARVGQAAL